MRIDTLVDEILEALIDDDYFDDMLLQRALPNKIKETRLSKVNIAVGLNGIDVSPNQIDGDTLAGDVSLIFNIFIPISMDDRGFSSILNKICSDLCYKNIVSIKTNKICVNSNIQAYELEASITFRDEISFGGREDE